MFVYMILSLENVVLNHICVRSCDVCRDHDFEHVTREPSNELRICGFLDIADLASPPYLSRHLLLPVSGSVHSIIEVSVIDERVQCVVHVLCALVGMSDMQILRACRCAH